MREHPDRDGHESADALVLVGSQARAYEVVWETPRLYAAQGGSAIGMARLGNSTAVKACGSIGPTDMAGGKAK